MVAFTPETAGLLKQNGLYWTCDVTYTDLPIKIHTPHGPIAGVPTTDFSDNRVLRASSRDLFDVHRGTFDYLRQHETIGLQTLVIHCQFGGRPLITAVLTELLKYMQKSRDAWFTTHEALADWALKQDVDEHTFQSRYFAAQLTRKRHMPYATTKDNVKLYYEEAGSGTPILFCARVRRRLSQLGAADAVLLAAAPLHHLLGARL